MRRDVTNYLEENMAARGKFKLKNQQFTFKLQLQRYQLKTQGPVKENHLRWLNWIFQDDTRLTLNG